MNKLTKVGVALGMAFAMFFVTSCGNANGAPETAADYIAMSVQKMENAKEMDVDVKMDLDMAMFGQNISTVTTSHALIFTDPVQAKIESNTDMGEEGNVESTVYVGMEGEKLYTYVGTEGAWYKQEVMDGDVNGVLSSYGSQDTELYLENKDNFTIRDKVEEEGKTYTVLEGDLPKEAVQELFDQARLTEQLGADASVWDGLAFEDGFSLQVWVEDETVTVKKIIMDMTGVMDTLLKTSMGGLSQEETGANGLDASALEVGVSKCHMEMTYNKTKGVEGFEIPKEALDAGEME